MHLPIDRGSLFFETLGSGPPVLVMHGGLGLDHTVFRPWLDPLGDSVELIYYDHLANGRSTFAGDPEELTHEFWARTADELREHLDHERVLLFGHSHGAILALEYALRHPGRLHGLILSNVTPAFDYPDVVMANARRKAPDEETFQAVVDLLSGPVESDEAWAEGFRRIAPLYFHTWNPDRYEAVLDSVCFRAEAINRSNFACLPAYDITHRLDEITVPTLVVSGADDWIMPPEHAGARVAEGIPNARHVVFEDSGHWPFIEETGRFLEVVREWIDEARAVEVRAPV